MSPPARPGAFQVTRLITLALAGGVFLLWGVAWFLTEGGTSGMAPDMLPGSLALVAWAGVALPAFGGALYFRNRAAGGGQDARSATGASRSPAGPAEAQTSTIIAQALLEGPALLGGMLFLMLGTTPVAWIVLPVYLLGLALTWPQRDWFV